MFESHRRLLHRTGALFLVLALGLVDSTFADDGEPRVSLRGFGTLGALHSNYDRADFPGSFFQPSGAGHTHALAWSADSKLGVQADARISERLSGVIQLVAKQNDQGNYAPEVEWANVKYALAPDLSIRLGRTVSGPLIYSESRRVGYVYPWVRPPLEVYEVGAVTNKDGVDLNWRGHFDETVNVVDASYGSFERKLPNRGKVVGRRYVELMDTVERGPLTLRAGYSYYLADLRSPDLHALSEAFRQFGTALGAIPGLDAASAQSLGLARRLQSVITPYKFFALGASYEAGNWLLIGEWTRTARAKEAPATKAGYLSAVYRTGDVQTFLTYARSTAALSAPASIQTGGMPAPLAAAATALNAGLVAANNAYSFAQRDVAVGLRWDFAKNFDLKLQYDRLVIAPDSFGRLINIQPGFQTGIPIGLTSIAVDFVF